MNVVGAIWRKEVGTYFRTSTAYALGAVFLALTGFSFWRVADALARTPAMDNSMMMLFSSPIFWLAILTMAPLLTMRLFVEERRNGSMELMLSAPVSPWQFVTGKFLGAYTVFLLAWLPTLSYAWILRRFGTEGAPVDLGPLAAGYLGTALVGAFLIAVGIFCSLCSSRQIVADILCIIVVSVLFYAALPLPFLSGMPKPFAFFSIVHHMADFARGTVDTRAIIWYATSTLLTLFLSTLLMEARRLR